MIDTSKADPAAIVRAAIAHLDHVLPGQAPILDFVHHNTLHGFQHLHFTAALDAAESLTGHRGYLPDEAFRQFYRDGRIDDSDLDDVLAARTDRDVLQRGDLTISRKHICRIALVFGLERIDAGEFAWQVGEALALERFQPDVPERVRTRLLEASGTEANAVGALWRSCLSALGLQRFDRPVEELVLLLRTAAEARLAEFHAVTADAVRTDTHVLRQMRAVARVELQTLFDDLGLKLSLRGLLLALTGQDVLDEIRPQMIRWFGSHLDEGLAAWHAPERHKGAYAVWRRVAATDAVVQWPNGAHWVAELSMLPDDPVAAIIASLSAMGIPLRAWDGYLQRVALELPGWAGIVNWRQHRPAYRANARAPVDLADWLAIRLFYDRVYLEPLCQSTFGVAAEVSALRRQFEGNLPEFIVRRALFGGERLPEYLSSAASKLLRQSRSERDRRVRLEGLAEMIWRSRHLDPTAKPDCQLLYHSVWRLFRLVQLLGLTPVEAGALSRTDAENLLAEIDLLTPSLRGYLWLLAYERHYREDLFGALAQNRASRLSTGGPRRPDAQIVFCMDDREESMRRHVEELNPAIETYGAAGFFGIAMNFRGLDDTHVTPLCPVVVTPSHELREVPRESALNRIEGHERARRWSKRLKSLLHHELRRNLFSAAVGIVLLAPASAVSLFGRAFAPRSFERLLRVIAQWFVPSVPTHLQTSADDERPATPQSPRLGFTDAEQADRIAGFLRTIGLVGNFAPLVVIAGHGSSSLNNPHRAAYDCGACSGRHGGPNARAFAAIANRPEIRERVRAAGIVIPEDTWFIGSEHNTGSDAFEWFDLADLNESARSQWQQLDALLAQALELSAHERCRRLASAPRAPTPPRALRHVTARTLDFSQARPELGHATNAAAVIGRRSLTRGAFLDRRVFLISYDPTVDPDGRIVEGILLAAGPVGAGINLEYYFSTVNNDRFGCGSKVPHNVTGMFGVMEGTGSDLRTGLPRQMIEIHEAMRLQLLVEAREEILGAIYERQPALKELIGNGWLLLSAIDPETGAISRFDPAIGFVPWRDQGDPLPVVSRSGEWYAGHMEPRPPALIRPTGVADAA